MVKFDDLKKECCICQKKLTKTNSKQRVIFRVKRMCDKCYDDEKYKRK